mmetsp:Transcript_5421/g.8066  ORF Transcript_5421/g.8066 Transcript_5421/m.8066 type:complete len:439 (-) Transcript_5421:452-1768(-)
MPSSKRRRRRQKQIFHQKYSSATTDQTVLPLLYCDLDVPLVLRTRDSNDQSGWNTSSTAASSSKNNDSKNNNRHTGFDETRRRDCNKNQHALIERLKKSGYSVIAMSHAIANSGEKLSIHRDAATWTIPTPVTITAAKKSSQNYDDELYKGPMKKRTRSGGGDECCEVLRRLNVVIEKVSELGLYCSNIADEATLEVLKSYDVIAMSPRNDECFSSICTMSNLLFCDVITLDYTSGSGNIQLPFKLKSGDIKAATDRGIVFELPYGPALVDPSKRKAFIQTARLFLNASVGVKGGEHRQIPRIIVSSGSRAFENKDHGAMALRCPDDMINFLNVVLGFDQNLARDALTRNAHWAIQRGRNRRAGKVASSERVDIGKGISSSLNFEVIDALPNISKIDDEAVKQENVATKNTESDDEPDNNGNEERSEEFDHDEDFLRL